MNCVYRVYSSVFFILVLMFFLYFKGASRIEFQYYKQTHCKTMIYTRHIYYYDIYVICTIQFNAHAQLMRLGNVHAMFQVEAAS